MVYISLFIVQGEQLLQCQDSGQTESDCSVQDGSVSLSPNERDSLQSHHDNAGNNLIHLVRVNSR